MLLLMKSLGAVASVRKEGSEQAAEDEVVPGYWIVEVTARAAEGQHVQAASAIGLLSRLLEPLVLLEKL